MNFQLKALIAVGIVMLCSAVFFSEVESQGTSMMSMVCNKTRDELEGWDSCKNKPLDGKTCYQSVSSCYVNNMTNQYTYRYDYYKCYSCIPTKPTQPCVAMFNCSQAPTYINNCTDVFNYFNPTSQKCDLSSAGADISEMCT